jgi:hypothetical protein
MMWTRICLVACSTLAAASLSLSVAAQSLAETARKERERREALRDSAEESRTLTERDLAAAKGRVANEDAVREAEADADEEPVERAAPPETQVLAGAPRPLVPEVDAEAAARRQKELAWRERASRARQRLEDAREAHLYWQRALLLGRGWRTDENGRRVMLSPRSIGQRAQRAEDELHAAEEAWKKLEEDARRASVPPGWLR